jgi:hypothetical protein
LEGFSGIRSRKSNHSGLDISAEGTQEKHGWQANSGDGDNANQMSFIDPNKINTPFYLLWLPLTA